MPLIIEQPPRGAERVVDAAIGELVGHGSIAMPRGASPSLGSPMPVYHLGADALAERRGLAAASQVGWLTSVRNDTEVMGSLEFAPVARPRKGQPPVRFASFTQGPLHRGIADVVAAETKRVGRRRVKARLLRAPAVYLLALWLEEGDGDTLVAIAPAPPPLKAGEPLPAVKALAALASSAKQAVAGDDARN